MKEMFGGTVVGVGKCGKKGTFFFPKGFSRRKKKKEEKSGKTFLGYF